MLPVGIQGIEQLLTLVTSSLSVPHCTTLRTVVSGVTPVQYLRLEIFNLSVLYTSLPLKTAKIFTSFLFRVIFGNFCIGT